MITSLSISLATPLAVILTEDGDEAADIIPANALRDYLGDPFIAYGGGYLLAFT